MRRLLLIFAVVGITVTTAFTVLAGNKCGTPCGTASTTTGGESSAGSSATVSCGRSGKTTAVGAAGGKLTGKFDAAMSGVCRFACATRLKYDAKSVLAQPGTRSGKLTQCPVSGIVFVVEANRPHVTIGKDEYITCCDKCATKLKRNPRHYLRV